MTTLPEGADYPITIEAGFAHEFIVELQDAGGDPINITGQTATMPFTGDDGTIFTLTAGDGLTIDAAGGVIAVRISGARTTLIASQVRLSSRRYHLRLDPWEKLVLEGPVSDG